MGLIDDDPRKKGMKLRGAKVLGTTADLPHVLRDNRPDEILIAIPSAPGELRRRVVEAARAEGVPVKTLPGLYELISGDVDLAGQIRPVQVEDVLGREPVEVDLGAIASFLSGETVLVTGAGGSIGAELCRQIARLDPSRLILVDHAEPALFEIERELVDERDFKACFPILADVKSAAKMRQVCERYRPTVVFHAAAYKHVPLMEANPLEAVRNNTLATKVLADAAVATGAKRFVLVSTDKAANPKNLMGQSKALCEWIVESYGARTDVSTRFCAVRFGNVLGSRGSVVPTFFRQIAQGGPVTVTDPSMARYFMSVHEAVQLVLQAAALSTGGEVFTLEMGEPMNVLDLARKLIRLSGKVPEKDITIQIVGARPGEKLVEDIIDLTEDLLPSAHPGIRVSRPTVPDPARLRRAIRDFELLALADESDELGASLKAVVAGRERVPIQGAV
jgi:FlaA1/EpsC-like NDP-sugar epimerase